MSILLVRKGERILKKYQKCKAGPTKASPNRENLNVLFRSADGASSKTSYSDMLKHLVQYFLQEKHIIKQLVHKDTTSESK